MPIADIPPFRVPNCHYWGFSRRVAALGHLQRSDELEADGTKPIEFEKGKAGIAVASRDKLPASINSLISGVRAGELDDLLARVKPVGPHDRRASGRRG